MATILGHVHDYCVSVSITIYAGAHLLCSGPIPSLSFATTRRAGGQRRCLLLGATCGTCSGRSAHTAKYLQASSTLGPLCHELAHLIFGRNLCLDLHGFSGMLSVRVLNDKFSQRRFAELAFATSSGPKNSPPRLIIFIYASHRDGRDPGEGLQWLWHENLQAVRDQHRAV